MTALDVINGGAGTDTLSIVDTAGVLTAAPSSVTLTSIEAMSISTTGDLGVVAGGVTAVAQIDKVTFPTVTADVQQINQLVISTSAGTDGLVGFSYGGVSGTFTVDASAAATSAANAVAAINATTGAVRAYAGGTATITDVSTGSTVAVGSNVTASVKVGMTVSAGNGYSSTVTGVAFASGVTTITLAAAITAATGTTLTYGGGAGGVTVYGATDGSNPGLAITSNASSESITPTLVKAGVQGNEGTVVSFTYAGQAGQYTIGATNDATATNFAAALNNVASTATAAVVAGTGDTDHVTLTADTAGTALGALVFSGAGSNSPTVTTTTANTAATAVSAAAYDVSGMTADAVNVVMADSANLKAAATSDVNVSGVTGAIVVDGGKNVIVNDSTADKAITLSNAKGVVTVTDSKQGTAGITVNDGTNVTIAASARDNNTSTITVGDAADVVTGAVVINATGKAYAAGASETFGAISVQGGTTVNVTQVATSDGSKIATDTSAGTHTFGTTTVNAENGTTEITIIQDEAVAAVNYEAAVAAKAATQKITVKAMAAGDVYTLTYDTSDSISFTAARALTAAEAANAFANLVALATEGKAPRADGFYTSAGTIDKSWTSGAVTTNEAGTEAYVTFSTATASPTDLVATVTTGTAGSFADGSVTAGATANQAVTGRIGIANGNIDINGATTSTKDAVKTVTLTNFGNADIDSDVIETLNLTGSAGTTVVTTASTGAVTVNANNIKTGSQISLDGGSATVTEVTLNASGKAVTTDLIAAAAKKLTLNAGVKVTSEGSSSLGALTTLVVTGVGAVDLSATSQANTLTSVNASGNTGGLTITIGSDTATFVGGSGSDVVTTDSETISKAIDLGDGDDIFVLAAYSSGTSVTTGTLNGGAGVDTISMSSATAAGLDDNDVFKNDISSFEVLSLAALANSANIVTKNLGLNSNIIVAGTASNGSATVSGLAANATVKITATVGTGALTAALDVATGTADVINLATDIDGNLTVGKVVVANVETVNLSAVDKFVDVSGAKDEFDANIADGKDDTNSEQSITLDIDEATTLNITGSADLTVDILDTNNSGADIVTTLVDASTFTGKLTLVADGKISGTTVKGGSGADTLTADGDNDVLIGGAGNDKLTATTLSTLTGGEGNDTFVFQTAVTATNYSTITDLSAGDVIQLVVATTNEFRSTKVTGSAQTSFAQMLDLAVVAATSDTNDQETAWFQFGGNTYLVTETGANGTTYSGSDDVIIEIIGLVDLSKAVFNDATSTLTIV